MAHFLACLAGKEEPKVAAGDGLRALELAEAANESLKSGQAVAL
jgi:predicted dehydrogenase